jgi:hypothetical protein
VFQWAVRAAVSAEHRESVSILKLLGATRSKGEFFSSKVRRKNERNPPWPEAGKGARYLQQPIRRHRWGAHGRSAC